jgi:two-component system, NtrC family, sensor kinase
VSVKLRSRIERTGFDKNMRVLGVKEHRCVYDLLDFARLPMAIMEGSSQIVRHANPAFLDLTGKSREELVGKPFAAIVPRDDNCLVLLDRVFTTGHAESHTEPEEAELHPLYWSYEVWPVFAELADDVRRSGVIFQVTETAPFHSRVITMNEALLRSAVRQHQLREAAETARAELQIEMKERKYAQEALLRSEMLASAGRFAASIAHEINNPLEALMNLLYLARTAEGLPKVASDHIEAANAELLRVIQITRQALSFYRESAAASSVSASGVMTSVVDLLRAKIKASGASVVQQCNEDVHVWAVFGELRQVIANLLVNSLHAIDHKGKIILRAAASIDPKSGNQRVRITIADSGQGIEGTAMKQIFQPFYTTKIAVGTGLGLWVCTQLIEKNKGIIKVRSNTSGSRRGTTISIVFATQL